MMNCREIQSLIVPFVEDKLDDEQMEAFLEHIEGCSSCYDELEVYFIVLSATRQLDNDYDDISDFKGELRKYIETKKEVYHRKHKHVVWARASVLAAMCFVAVLTVFITLYNAADHSLSVMFNRAIASFSGDFEADIIRKIPRTNICNFLLEYDGEQKIIITRKQEVVQDEKENSSD